MYRVDCERVNATPRDRGGVGARSVAALAAWIDQNLAVVYDARRLRHAVVLSSAEVSSAEGFTAVKNAGLAEQRASLVALLRDGRDQGVFPHAEPETDAVAIQAVVGAHMRGPARPRPGGARRVPTRATTRSSCSRRPRSVHPPDSSASAHLDAVAVVTRTVRRAGRRSTAPARRAPSSTRNTLPCHGHVMQPSRDFALVHRRAPVRTPRVERHDRAAMAQHDHRRLAGEHARGARLTSSAAATQVHSVGGARRGGAVDADAERLEEMAAEVAADGRGGGAGESERRRRRAWRPRTRDHHDAA